MFTDLDGWLFREVFVRLLVYFLYHIAEASSPSSVEWTSFLISIAFYHFVIVFGVIGGIGSSLLFTSSIASVGHFFKKRRGHATGITSGGGAFVRNFLFSMFIFSFELLGWFVVAVCS